MLENIVTSRTRRELLGFFAENAGGEFYLREIGKRLKEPLAAVQRELKLFEKMGLVSDRWVGPLKFFRLNPSHAFWPELRLLVLKDSRKKRLDRNLKKIVKILKEQYRPDKIILYGSYASGRIHPDSDLDLLIVKKEVPPRYWDRLREVSPLLAQRDVALDYTIWTPQELAESKETPFVKEEILRKGKILYEKARPEPRRRAA